MILKRFISLDILKIRVFFFPNFSPKQKCYVIILHFQFEELCINLIDNIHLNINDYSSKKNYYFFYYFEVCKFKFCIITYIL